MDLFKLAMYPMWVKYLVFAWLSLTLLLSGIILFMRQPMKEATSNITDAKLVLESKALSTEISNFVSLRQANEPLIDRDNWDASTNTYIKYGQENNTYYSSKFKGKVMVLRDEFKNRGLTKKDLDQYAEHPTNYIGFNYVASALNELSIKLENSIK